MYDATYLPGGAASAATLRGNGDAVHFVEETYKHFKPIAAAADGRSVLTAAVGATAIGQPGVVTGGSGAALAAAFVRAIAAHRHWARQGTDAVSA